MAVVKTHALVLPVAAGRPGGRRSYHHTQLNGRTWQPAAVEADAAAAAAATVVAALLFLLIFHARARACVCVCRLLDMCPRARTVSFCFHCFRSSKERARLLSKNIRIARAGRQWQPPPPPLPPPPWPPLFVLALPGHRMVSARARATTLHLNILGCRV